MRKLLSPQGRNSFIVTNCSPTRIFSWKWTILTALLFIVSGQIMAQSRVITGTITDASGTAVPNATVLIKGSKTGTSTGSDGSFSLTIPSSAKVLLISSVGMSTAEINIGDRGVFKITLSASEKGLTEVVVTALGIRKDKKTLGYGVSVLKAD